MPIDFNLTNYTSPYPASGFVDLTELLKLERTQLPHELVILSRNINILALNIRRMQEVVGLFPSWTPGDPGLVTLSTGPVGPSGVDGSQGLTGTQGLVGATGADSVVAGPTGPQGLQGIDGVLNYVQIIDQKTAGTFPAEFTVNQVGSGNYTLRELNTKVSDASNIADISAGDNKVELGVGTYRFAARAPARMFNAGLAAAIHRLIVIVEDSGSSTITHRIYGEGNVLNNNGVTDQGDFSVAEVRGRFTITATSKVSLYHYSDKTATIFKLGWPVGSAAGVDEALLGIASPTETYASVEFWRET